MSAAACNRGWEVDALRDGRLGPADVESFERHCRTCAACSEAMSGDQRLRELGRSLPAAEPGQLALKRLRARVLRDVTNGVPSRPLPPRRFVIAASLGIALVALVGWVVAKVEPRVQVVTAATSFVPSPAPLAGSVTPEAGAVWSQTRGEGVEKVVLATGTLQVHVRAQSPGERFLVQLPDGELEVRGTTFHVTALEGSTRHVDVDEGTVLLRIRGSAERSLGPSARWSAAESPAPPGSPEGTDREVAAAATAQAKRRSEEPRENPKDDDGAPAYVDAMRAFREGRYDHAAAAFHAFALVHPKAPEAEDASFLEAVSLARAGRADAAALAAERHLEGFPNSFRRKEASILVARAASRRGDCDQARRVVAAWTSDPPDAEVHAALRACDDGSPARP